MRGCGRRVVASAPLALRCLCRPPRSWPGAAAHLITHAHVNTHAVSCRACAGMRICTHARTQDDEPVGESAAVLAGCACAAAARRLSHRRLLLGQPEQRRHVHNVVRAAQLKCRPGAAGDEDALRPSSSMSAGKCATLRRNSAGCFGDPFPQSGVSRVGVEVPVGGKRAPPTPPYYSHRRLPTRRHMTAGLM